MAMRAVEGEDGDDKALEDGDDEDTTTEPWCIHCGCSAAEYSRVGSFQRHIRRCSQRAPDATVELCADTNQKDTAAEADLGHREDAGFEAGVTAVRYWLSKKARKAAVCQHCSKLGSDFGRFDTFLKHVRRCECKQGLLVQQSSTADEQTSPAADRTQRKVQTASTHCKQFRVPLSLNMAVRNAFAEHDRQRRTVGETERIAPTKQLKHPKLYSCEHCDFTSSHAPAAVQHKKACEAVLNGINRFGSAMSDAIVEQQPCTSPLLEGAVTKPWTQPVGWK